MGIVAMKVVNKHRDLEAYQVLQITVSMLAV